MAEPGRSAGSRGPARRMRGDASIDIGLAFPTRKKTHLGSWSGRVGCAQTELRAGTLA